MSDYNSISGANVGALNRFPDKCLGCVRLEAERDDCKAALEKKEKIIRDNDIAWARNHELIAALEASRLDAERLAKALEDLISSTPYSYHDGAKEALALHRKATDGGDVNKQIGGKVSPSAQGESDD